MAKIELSDVQGGFNLSQLNSNFDKIEEHLNEKVLYRNVPEGQPNQLQNDLDMNGKRIYNLPTPLLDHEPATKKYVKDVGGSSEKVIRVDDVDIPAIPDAAIRANKLLAFDSDGNPIVALPSADSATALRLELQSDEGASLVGFDGGTLEDVAVNAKSLQNYTALRAYNGVATTIRILDTTTGGVFRYNPADISTADNNGTVVVDLLGRRWVRDNPVGDVNLSWFLSGATFNEALIQANTTPLGYKIIVAPGTYNLPTDITLANRIVILMGDVVFTGAGTILAATVIRFNTDGSVSFGSAQYGIGNSKYKFGSTGTGANGLQIGGADPKDGIEGTVFFDDGYSGWSVLQPSQYPSPIELAVQPSTIAGKCVTNGTNLVTRSSGGEFSASLVGYTIFIEDQAALISSVNVGAQTLTYTNFNGAPLTTIPAYPNATYVIAAVRMTGNATISGATVTRITGDRFVPLGNRDYKIRIGGVWYIVSAVNPNNTLTLSTVPAVQGVTSYEAITLVDDLMSAVRVHRLAGAGFEENLTFGAYGTGHFRIQAASGDSTQRPLYIGAGYTSTGVYRNNILMDATGNTYFGGGFDRYHVRVPAHDASTTLNAIRLEGAATGTGLPAAISTEGLDANIDLALAPKGNGKIKFNASIPGTVTPNRVLVCKDETGAEIQIPYYRA